MLLLTWNGIHEKEYRVKKKKKNALKSSGKGYPQKFLIFQYISYAPINTP